MSREGNVTYLSSLLEWLLVYSNQENSMGSETVTCSSLDIADQVLAGHEVNVVAGTKFGSHFLLLSTAIDGNDFETHDLSILASQRSESTTSTDDSDSLAWASSRLLQSLVDGDTSTEDWCNGLEVAFLGNAGNVCSLSNTVLLEGTVNGIAGKEGFGAEWLI